MIRFILASRNRFATDNEYRVPKPQDAEGRIPKGPDFAEGKILYSIPKWEPNLKGNWRPSDRAVRTYSSCSGSSAKVGLKRRTKSRQRQ
jgi:hypothetical protein